MFTHTAIHTEIHTHLSSIRYDLRRILIHYVTARMVSDGLEYVKEVLNIPVWKKESQRKQNQDDRTAS